MSKPRTTYTERNMLTLWPKNAERIKALCAEYPDGGNWAEFTNDIIDTFLTKYRSNKPLVLSEERFADRPAEREWEGTL